MAVDEGERQGANLAVCFVTDVAHHLKGDPIVDGRHEPLGQRNGCGGDTDFYGVLRDTHAIDVSDADHAVHGMTHENRDIEGQRDRNGSEHDRQRQQQAIAADVLQDFLYRFPLRRVKFLNLHAYFPPFMLFPV